jgi:hypothetical protein
MSRAAATAGAGPATHHTAYPSVESDTDSAWPTSSCCSINRMRAVGSGTRPDCIEVNPTQQGTGQPQVAARP